ncbi:tryptophan synthase subunit alpha [Candidatus Vallotia lariciata]|uniref:tryptophan synthase subunit alpha n=1 Tax=Candidatus Vallotia laricis TaxID=2018052 RepID=UPI001EEFC898|nr:tryptophan synthase subunit alpha [Candidatus Vallotia lariciata]UDG82967.1 Tryptophan synthase alpha chain [Candidatus Vallotia lariciata]
MVLSNCPPGGLVLDPFIGSSTTAVAYARHRRFFIGYEINPKYYSLTRQRLAKLRASQTLLNETYSMSRIETKFLELARNQRKGLIPFMTAGDPDPDRTVEFMHALAASGADIIELGIPFSDPMADGPVIQRSSERALARGITLRRVLDYVRVFCERDRDTPVVLMGYANPIEQMGCEVFGAAAREAGVDGVLVVDYPPEEASEFAAAMRSYSIDPIFMLAPTSTTERIASVGRLASGYIYYVSLNGVTGSVNLNVSSISGKTSTIKSQVPLPIGVGFGIRDAATARAVAKVSDAVVIGSCIVQLLEQTPEKEAIQVLKTFITDIRQALDYAG